MPAEKRMKVFDLTATEAGGPRTHEIVVDKRRVSYKFSVNAPIEMPESHARKFLPIESFAVCDMDEARIFPTVPLNKGVVDKIALADNECVARLEELTIDALVARANVLPGGERISKNYGKDEVITFLLAARKNVVASMRPPKPTDDDEIIDDEELSTLVGDGDTESRAGA